MKPIGTILVVDDDPCALEALDLTLAAEGYAVVKASDGVEALAKLAETPADLVVTDLAMPKMDGMALLHHLREERPGLPVIIATSFSDVERVVEAMRAGAENFLTKPFSIEALSVAVARALEVAALRSEAAQLRRHVSDALGTDFHGLLGVSPAMQKTYRDAEKVAQSKATVLISGESGTGKGELARAIHEMSPRKNAPFVTLHCSALADSLLESELFGHEKGAFTGADRRRIGHIEQAQGGTLFLDEIGEISPSTQVKLLRVLQERTLERVGSSEPIWVDVRIIAATNRDLASDVREGRFREDLYYRLAVCQIEMPPLRARGTDVLILAEAFLSRFALENKKRIVRFTDKARAKILGAPWLGNVRELENAIERAVIMTDGDAIEADEIPVEPPATRMGPGVVIPGATMAEIERYAILTTLDSVHGSTTQAANILDIAVRTVQYRMASYRATRASSMPPPPSGEPSTRDTVPPSRRRHDA